MSPRGGGEPNGDVAKVIDYYFNTFDNLKASTFQSSY